MDHTYKVPKDACPHCGYKADGVYRYSQGQERPRPGDFVVCMGCTELLQFREDMGVRVPTPESLAELPPEYMVQVEKSKEMVRNIRAATISKTGGN